MSLATLTVLRNDTTKECPTTATTMQPKWTLARTRAHRLVAVVRSLAASWPNHTLGPIESRLCKSLGLITAGSGRREKLPPLLTISINCHLDYNGHDDDDDDDDDGDDMISRFAALYLFLALSSSSLLPDPVPL